MLDSIIAFSLHNRMLILAAALIMLFVGAMQTAQLPIDVFPDLNRPRVVVITEAPGMAPERGVDYVPAGDGFQWCKRCS